MKIIVVLNTSRPEAFGKVIVLNREEDDDRIETAE